jgi:hypothetical protein
MEEARIVSSTCHGAAVEARLIGLGRQAGVRWLPGAAPGQVLLSPVVTGRDDVVLDLVDWVLEEGDGSQPAPVDDFDPRHVQLRPARGADVPAGRACFLFSARRIVTFLEQVVGGRFHSRVNPSLKVWHLVDPDEYAITEDEDSSEQPNRRPEEQERRSAT